MTAPKLIGREPTEEMIKADPYGMGYGRLHAIWRSMWDAAPQVDVPSEVLQAVERMRSPLHESWLSGVTAREDARCMQIIADFIGSLAASHQPASDLCERCNKPHASVDCAPEDLAAAEARIRALDGDKPCR